MTAEQSEVRAGIFHGINQERDSLFYVLDTLRLYESVYVSDETLESVRGQITGKSSKLSYKIREKYNKQSDQHIQLVTVRDGIVYVRVR